MNLSEKTVSQKYMFHGRIIHMRVDDILLPNGKEAEREVVEHPGGVCVAALTEDNEIFFVRQFRYPYGQVLLEIPAGKLERGEDPLTCGKRELLEEAGVIAEKYTSLGILYPTPGYCNEIIHMYLAEDLRLAHQNLDEDEFLTVEKIPLKTAVEMIVNHKVPDAKTQAAVLKVAAMKAMF
ncbi:MAG: ADP-ribose pyrophosphatase [Clostridiales bacterium 43-6]|nr:MAG: ADP-ribose pyrophosphatase [Clostridiales bacterium 43-6]